MFCIKCGKENPEGSTFCIGCGNAMNTAPKAASQPPAVKLPQPKPKRKKNAAALALAAVSVVLAIMLILSLTGVFAAGSMGVASRSFSTPEDAIKYFIERLKAQDINGALSACAINEMAKGFDYAAFAERIKSLQPLAVTNLPSDYKEFIEYNRIKITKDIMLQMIAFSSTFYVSEKYWKLLNTPIQLSSDVDPESLIKQLDPSKISGLKILDIGKSSKNDTTVNRKNQKSIAKTYGADDEQFRTVLYEYDGDYYAGGFTLIEYGNRWQIANLVDPIAGISAYGAPIKLEEKSDFDSYIE
jgi:hypothetical protein